MKVRKLAVALALAGGLGSGVAQALGLGEIELQSYLNEPMEAEIILPQSRGVDPGDVFVNIAPQRAYQRLGLQRNPYVGKLRFNVTTSPDGRLVVNVSSREPLREPYLNFLLELTWPNGRLMREYAVLVDPPVYAEDSGVREQVRAPASASTTLSRSATSGRSAESVRRQARVEQSRSSGYGSDTFGPTGASDTLWTIASAVRPDNSLSMQQVMLALQDLNPDAFIGNNINRLKRGEVLRVPTAEQIRSRSRAEATRIVARQNEEFQQPARTVDATSAQQSGSSSDAGGAQASGDELKLLVAGEDEGGRSETEGGSAGGDSQSAGGVDAGTAVAMEELESARRENDELNSRVEDLQDQVETLQRLIELKNSQLSEVQQSVAGGEAASETAPAAEDGATPEEALVDEATAGDEAAAVEDEEIATAPDESGDMAGLVDDEPAGADAPAAGDDPEQSSEPVTAETDSPTDAMEADSAQESPDGSAVDDVAPVTDDTASAAEETVQQPAQPEVEESKPEPEPAADKGFPGNIIDAITGNTVYQIALGGGLIVLLLLLLLLARRNANREKAFYEQLNNETDGPEDTFDLSLDEEDPEQGGTADSDALEEADTYVAYGRYDQAAQVLEAAISREPSRTDLRLKLLEVYADNQDRDSFEKQYGEIQTLADDDALAQAAELRSRLEEAESMPSMDDLESQLRSGSFGDDTADDRSDNALSDELLADQYDAGKEEQVENEFGDFDSDLSDFDLDTLDDSEATADAESGGNDGEGEKQDSADDMIEYDLSGLEMPETDDAESTEDASGETDFSSLEIDLDEPEESLDEPVSQDSDESPAPEAEAESDDVDIDSLDESFLDELDAELDKVAGEEGELGGSEMEESTLDDLELDVSDEDLALMEEFSDSADSANTDPEEDELSLDDELELDDTLSDGDLTGESDTASPEQEVAGEEELSNLDDLDNLDSVDDLTEDSADELNDEELPVASDEVREEGSKSALDDIDENDLGDDDDFDFLAGTDEAATKLDLARAYIEMGDNDGARDILEEVSLEGDDEQKAEAQDLLKKLS